MSNFITFGCWNKGNCIPGPELSNPLSRVIAKMDSYIRTPGKELPSFVCVAGDNYYPEIVGKGPDKKKHLSIPDLRSGFDCLSEFQKKHPSIPIDIIAGNHDTENTNKMTVIQGSTHVVEEPCIITKAEIDSTMHHHNMNFTMFNYRIINNTLVIMLDSNIYCETLGDEELQCYTLLVNHTLSTLKLEKLHDGSPITVDQLKVIQGAWLDRMYGSIGTRKFANVVIVAHHPLALYKVKNKECRYDIVEKDYLEFCHSIYTHLRDRNNSLHFFYSCADLHTYQSGTVTIHHASDHSDTITISQEIAGTGGAHLETEYANMQPECSSVHTSKLVEYHMTKINHNHGFLHWLIDSGSGNLSATFIPVDSVLSGSASASGSGSASGSARDGGTKRRRQRASKRRRQRTSKRRSKRQRRIRRSRSRSRSRH